jgi:hypothetical protein
MRYCLSGGGMHLQNRVIPFGEIVANSTQLERWLDANERA